MKDHILFTGLIKKKNKNIGKRKKNQTVRDDFQFVFLPVVFCYPPSELQHAEVGQQLSEQNCRDCSDHDRVHNHPSGHFCFSACAKLKFKTT